jgi:branched-chain amino acid transport system permease protein
VRLGRISPGIVLTAALMVLVGIGGPLVVDQFGLLQLTVFASMCILALSLGVVWGYGGILCFGQSAFFGLGAYTYAVTAINLGESTLAIALSVVLPGVFAALLGYFMFYGRLSDVYLGVITLSVTLIFFNLMNSTAGDAYRIGSARLNGFNGMPSLPTFNVPGNPGRLLDPTETFYLVMALLLIVYVGLHALLASHFGRVVVAVRENETRCELLGYDVRLHKLLIFTLGGAIAGLAGSLFANWGAFVSPNVFSLGMTSQIIIWVIVGGLGTLGGTIIGCLIMQYLATELGTQQLANTSLIFGIIFLAFVLLVPRGVVPALIAVRARLSGAVRARLSGAPRARPIA